MGVILSLSPLASLWVKVGGMGWEATSKNGSRFGVMGKKWVVWEGMLPLRMVVWVI